MARRSSGCAREDFGELRHHGGVSPAWPIGYDDLEPYYTRGRAPVPRARRIAARIRPSRRRADRTRIPRSATSRASSSSSDDFARAGLRPFHVPLGIMLDEQHPQHEPVHPLRHVRRLSRAWSMRSPTPRSCASIPRSQHPNVTLLTNAYVERLETSAFGPRGHDGVIVERNGSTETYSGRRRRRRPAGAINSAALLLRSANEKHPRGLANGSDVVGRHYMGHINSVLMAVSRCPNPTVFQKTLGVNDFYFGIVRLAVSDGAHLLRRQARWRRALGGRACRSRRDSRST